MPSAWRDGRLKEEGFLLLAQTARRRLDWAEQGYESD